MTKPSQDLAPTLAFLTGVSIPENNVGALIPNLMITTGDGDGVNGDSEAAEAFYCNTLQVSKVLKSNLGEETAMKSEFTGWG